MYNLYNQEAIVTTTFLPEMDDIHCMELSSNQKILYIAGDLKSENARKSCPIIIFDADSGFVKSKWYIICLLWF